MFLGVIYIFIQVFKWSQWQMKLFPALFLSKDAALENGLHLYAVLHITTSKWFETNKIIQREKCK